MDSKKIKTRVRLHLNQAIGMMKLAQATCDDPKVCTKYVVSAEDHLATALAHLYEDLGVPEHGVVKPQGAPK